MKKLKYIVIALAVVLLVASGVYIGYKWNNTDSSYKITHEIRKTIEESWPEEGYLGTLKWGKNATRFYGSHGDSLVVFSKQGFLVDSNTEFQVGGITFFLRTSFKILVFRDGKCLDIRDAYDQGCLTWWQVRSIAEFHRETWGNGADPIK